MIILAFKWLLPFIAIGFLAGAIFRLRAQLAGAAVLVVGSLYYFFAHKYVPDAGYSAFLFLLGIPLFLASYGGGAVFGKFVQSEIKGRPVMLTVSVLTVGLFLFTTTNAALYR